MNNPATITESIELLSKILKELAEEKEKTIPALKSNHVDNLERLLSALMASVRMPRGTTRRKPTRSEHSLLEKFAVKLSWKMKWADHLSAFDAGERPMLLAEPFGIDPDDLHELSLLNNNGWEISVQDDFATYFPGRACCILMRPPTRNELLMQKSHEYWKRKSDKLKARLAKKLADGQ